jgi:DNA-binding beta-propeller fold protein YncE
VRGRIWLRAVLLALALAAVIGGLTAYFSSASVPPCLVSGTPTWHPPTDASPHRYAVVFPDHAACFFAIDGKQTLVGQLRLNDSKDVTTGKLTQDGLAPFDHGTLTAVDAERQRMYVTQPGLLGFRVIDMHTGQTIQVVHFKGFTWNPRFGPNPPSHGIVLRPDRPELWVLDAANHALHVFDVSAAPRPIADVRLERTLTTPGSLTQSADGRYLYVGGTGDVIDTQSRTPIANLDALQQATAVLEVDWVGGRPIFPGFPR